METRMIYMTASSMAEARAIAGKLVSERLVACANILSEIHSIYWWKGNMEEAEEVAVLFKTRESLIPALIERVKSLHSYECPCIVSLPIVAGYAPFLQWIVDETDAAIS